MTDTPTPSAPHHLRCEGLDRPLGVDIQAPLLGWTGRFLSRGEGQTAYQLRAASAPDPLAHGVADLWDSGRVASGRRAAPYGGPPLRSSQRVCWQVRVWGRGAAPSPWSAPAEFGVGLLDPGDWEAAWIGAGAALDNTATPHAAVLLRRSFSLGTGVTRAVLHLCGLGHANVTLNGQPVTDAQLEPGYTDYDRRVLYVSHDVTGQLRPGENVLGVTLGGGFYHLATPDLFGLEQAPWRDHPKLIARLHLEREDGSAVAVTSDGAWRWSTAQVVFNCLRGGETHDWRRAQPGWDTPGVVADHWWPVALVAAPRGALRAQLLPPIRVLETVPACGVSEPVPGVHVFDLGRNLSGWARLEAAGPAGQRVTLRFAERLGADGRISDEGSGHTYGRYQTGELIFSGRGREAYEPSSCHHGFRYVEVSGLASAPALHDLVGRRVHADLPSSGVFACSDAQLTRVHEVFRSSLLHYTHHHPADAAREKMGWTQDVMNLMDAYLLNFDAAPMLRKWYEDFLDAQDPGGHMPSIAPTGGWGRVRPDGAPGEYADPWWGGMLVLLPWRWYRHLDDDALLRRGYPAMRRWVKYVLANAPDGIVDWWLGDWGEVGAGPSRRPDRTPVALTSTCALYLFTSLAADAAEHLGYAEDAADLRETAEQVRAAANARFLDAARGVYASGSQSAQAVPLWTGLVPQGTQERAFEQLIEAVHERDDHLSVGFVGLVPLLEVLSQGGQLALAHRIATQPDFPGWVHMLAGGATAIPEYWAPHEGVPNIPNLAGPLDAWLFQWVAGLRPEAGSFGWQRIHVEPGMSLGMSWARAELTTPRGRLAVDWQRRSSQLHLNLEVPAGCGATVHLPPATGPVTDQGRPVEAAEGVRVRRNDAQALTLEVVSGRYAFDLALLAAPPQQPAPAVSDVR